MRASRRATRTGRRLFRLCLSDGRLDAARARQVAALAVASGRRHRLNTLTAFARFVRLYRERYTAAVTSAVPLTDDVRDAVRAGLTRVYGADLAASFADDPALIGGMRIKVGSDVYDGSVAAKLARLRQGFGGAGSE